MDEHISVRAEMYRRNGRWQILIRAPRWLISDVANQIMRERGMFVLANYGGGMDEGTHTMLLQTAARVSEQQIPVLEAASEFHAAAREHDALVQERDACSEQLNGLVRTTDAAHERVRSARQRLLDLAAGNAL